MHSEFISSFSNPKYIIARVFFFVVFSQHNPFQHKYLRLFDSFNFYGYKIKLNNSLLHTCCWLLYTVLFNWKFNNTEFGGVQKNQKVTKKNIKNKKTGAIRLLRCDSKLLLNNYLHKCKIKKFIIKHRSILTSRASTSNWR